MKPKIQSTNAYVRSVIVHRHRLSSKTAFRPAFLELKNKATLLIFKKAWYFRGVALSCFSRNKHKRLKLQYIKFWIGEFDYFWCQNVIARFIGNRCDVFYIFKKCKFLYGVNLYSVVYHCAQLYRKHYIRLEIQI